MWSVNIPMGPLRYTKRLGSDSNGGALSTMLMWTLKFSLYTCIAAVVIAFGLFYAMYFACCWTMVAILKARGQVYRADDGLHYWTANHERISKLLLV